jgi:CheY-like chemotaxis protein
MRVVVAEDSVLFREGLVRLLTDLGHEVAAAVGDAEREPPWRSTRKILASVSCSSPNTSSSGTAPR